MVPGFLQKNCLDTVAKSTQLFLVGFEQIIYFFTVLTSENLSLFIKNLMSKVFELQAHIITGLLEQINFFFSESVFNFNQILEIFMLGKKVAVTPLPLEDYPLHDNKTDHRPQADP